MEHRTLVAPARPVACAFVLALATTMLVAPSVLAQTPAPKAAAPKAKAPPAAQPQPKGAPAAPAEQQAAPAEPQLIFSPWNKFCLKGQEAGAKQVCFTGKDGRVESGMPVVAAVLIEPEGEPKKNSACDFAARHVNSAWHASDRRSGPADDRALCDLFSERLHGRL